MSLPLYFSVLPCLHSGRLDINSHIVDSGAHIYKYVLGLLVVLSNQKIGLHFPCDSARDHLLSTRGLHLSGLPSTLPLVFARRPFSLVLAIFINFPPTLRSLPSRTHGCDICRILQLIQCIHLRPR